MMQFSKKLINYEMHCAVFVYSTALFCNIKHSINNQTAWGSLLKGQSFVFLCAGKLKKFRRQSWARERHFKPSENIDQRNWSSHLISRGTKPGARGEEDCSAAGRRKEIRNSKPVHLGLVCVGWWWLHPDRDVHSAIGGCAAWIWPIVGGATGSDYFRVLASCRYTKFWSSPR